MTAWPSPRDADRRGREPHTGNSPTTFIRLVESNLDTYAFGARAAQGLAHEDLVLVFDPEDMSACYFGPVEDEGVLRTFFKQAKKLD